MYFLEITEPSSQYSQREFRCIWSTGSGLVMQGEITGRKWYADLMMDPETVRLDYMNSGYCPVNLAHRGKQVGVVVENSAYIEDGKGFATIRFSSDSFAKKILGEIKSGSRSRAVSLGAKLFDYLELKGTKKGLKNLLYDEWEMNEIALVDRGADPGARILI